MLHRFSTKILALGACLAVAGTLLTGCAPRSADEAGEHDLHLAALAAMPAEVQAAPVTVQDAYRFAAANPDVLEQLPCYCGCGAMGHTSNYACYVGGRDESGALQFDSHALGCGICVDITLDAMRLLKEGRTVAEIRTYVDTTYAKYGPSNMP